LLHKFLLKVMMTNCGLYTIILQVRL